VLKATRATIGGARCHFALTSVDSLRHREGIAALQSRTVEVAEHDCGIALLLRAFHFSSGELGPKPKLC